MESWEDLLEIDEQWEELDHQPKLGPMRTKAYWVARKRRVEYLRRQIEQGTYVLPPAELVAEGILYGQARWGESAVNECGKALDEVCVDWPGCTLPWRSQGNCS